MVKKLFGIAWPFLVLLGPYFLFGALVGSVPGAMLYSYIWRDSRFCASCHVHDYASVGWKSSIHGELTTCNDCHHQSLLDYARESIVLVTRQPKLPADLHRLPQVSAEICGTCHLSKSTQHFGVAGPLSRKDLSKLPKVDQLYLHQVHLQTETRLPLENSSASAQRTSSKRNVLCMDCHGGPANRAHDFSVADRSCVRCHTHTHRTELLRKFGCRNCHYQDFLTPR